MNIKLYNQIMHYKFLKKIIGILGFKLVNKNLIKNNRLLSNYTSTKIEKIVENLFINNEIKTIIQIGSNDGQRFDFLGKFIKKYFPKVIFVEPILTSFKQLKEYHKNQDNLFFENSAISVNSEINKLFKVKENKLNQYDNHVAGITSFNKKHLIMHGIKKKHVTEEKVNSISTNELLNKYSINNFDFLIIDTEGYDAKIVLDFLLTSKIRPTIFFEYIHSENEILKKTLEILKINNYYIFKIEENLACFHKNIIEKVKFF